MSDCFVLYLLLTCMKKKTSGADKFTNNTYFTMEWRDNKIIQCRGMKNCGMPADVQAFVKVFEKKMNEAIQGDNKKNAKRKAG